MQKQNWRTNEGVCSLKHLDAGARVICNGVQYCGFLLLYMFKKDRRPLLVFSNKYNKSNRELITRDFTLLGGTPSHDYLHGKKVPYWEGYTKGHKGYPSPLLGPCLYCK